MKFKKLFLALAVCSACCCFAADAKIEAAPAPAAAPAAPAKPAEAPSAPAADKKAEPDKKAGTQSSWKSMIVPVLLIVVMIFLFTRANKKQQRQRQEMMNKIVKGTQVLLNSGVYAKVVEVKENDFLVEIADNVRVLVVKEGIARVMEEEKKEEAK